MRFRTPRLRPALAAAAVAAALLLSAAAAPDAAAGRQVAPAPAAPAQTVVRFSVTDKEGRPVPDLRAEDVRVTLEGVAQQVASLAPAKGEPLRLAVMLDVSASQEVVLPAAKRLAAEFVAGLLRHGRDDAAAVVSFSGDATVVQGLTDDLGALRRAFASVEFVPPKGYVPGGIIIGPPPRNPPWGRAGTTAIWDSLEQVCERVFAGAPGGRRAVVLFTDGVDTSSRTKSDRAVERLLREGVAVYSVGFGDTHSFDGVEKGGLRKVSGRTGGLALFPRKPADLPAAFEQVGSALRSAYAVAFSPQSPKAGGKLRRLRVEVVNPALRGRGVEVAHPYGLFHGAPPPPPR